MACLALRDRPNKALQLTPKSGAAELMCKTIHMKKFLLLMIFIFCSCSFIDVDDVVVSNHQFVLNNKQIETQCVPPLKRSRKSGSIFITIQETWRPEAPWKQIRLNNRVMVTVNVVLVGNNGKEYVSNLLGSATGSDGQKLDARFDPAIPKNIKINSIKLSASSKITIN